MNGYGWYGHLTHRRDGGGYNMATVIRSMERSDFGVGVEVVNTARFTSEEGLFWMTGATSNAVRDGSILNVRNGSWTSYDSNPVILHNHGRANGLGGEALELSMPVGRVESRAILADGTVALGIRFDTDDEFGARIDGKVRRGFLNTLSIGFRALSEVHRSELPEGHWARGERGYFFESYEPLEHSTCSVPMDPGCLPRMAEDNATRALVEASGLSSDVVRQFLPALDAWAQSRGFVIGQSEPEPIAEPAPAPPSDSLDDWFSGSSTTNQGTE